MIRSTLICLSLACLVASPVPACPPPVAVRGGHVAPAREKVVVKEVVEPVAVATFVPVAVAVPAVAVGYAAPAAPPAGPAPALAPTDEVARLRAELAELKRQMADARGPAPKVTGSITARCAACHGATAKADGKGHRFFDDAGQAQAGSVGRMIKAVKDGLMPLGPDGKPAPLSDEDYARFVDELAGAK
jgi:cytochrome c553